MSKRLHDVDVAIVGYGPVGQTLAALLGGAGHRVAVFERFSEIYRLPRAVHLDHEIMRLLQSLSVDEELAGELLPAHDYHWFGADGEPLMTMQAPVPAVSGWEPDYLFFQPALEAGLARRAASCPSVTVKRGWVAESLVAGEDGAELSVRQLQGGETRSISAGWVIGADGANSFVRETMGITRRDLGFQERWLVVDVKPHDMSAIALPPACQWCDPRRPTTHIQSGTSHRRWEFMLLPGEDAADFEDEARIWELLGPWFGRQDGELTRHAVYEFRSMLADTMRSGPVLLVGDAAHLTPPFLGQGLCSGLRDAANVAWKLDLVLRGASTEALLDTVDPERGPHNEWIITVAIELGRVLCELDPQTAAERDAMLREADAPPPLALAGLTDGVLSRDADSCPGPLAGSLGVQGRVAAGSGEGLLDDMIGGGFALIAAAGDPRDHLDADARATLDTLGARIVSLDPAAGGDTVRDLDGRLTAWLQQNHAHAVLVRPDFYVFGRAESPAQLSSLVNDLRRQLFFSVPSTSDLEPRMPDATVIAPKFHHVNLKTTRLEEMIDWYSVLVGAQVRFQDAAGAWLSNDEANHRIALLAFPDFSDDAEKETHTGLHHSAFEYDSFEDLNSSYLRLREADIEPDICLDHGMTFSYYYKDPDGNHVELQVDNFGDWSASSEWMRTSPEFHANPIGTFVDPARVAEAAAAGESFAEIHRRATAGDFAPSQPPVDLPTEG